MSKHLVSFLTVIIIMSVSISCSETITFEENVANNDSEFRVISIEEAISSLSSFMEDMNLLITKNGDSRIPMTVDIHYGEKTIDGRLIPDAYLVNFEKNSGFAVLGANSDISPIIAITETGSIDWNTLMTAHKKRSDKQNLSDTTYFDIEPDEMMAICINAALNGKKTIQTFL